MMLFRLRLWFVVVVIVVVMVIVVGVSLVEKPLQECTFQSSYFQVAPIRTHKNCSGSDCVKPRYHSPFQSQSPKFLFHPLDFSCWAVFSSHHSFHVAPGDLISIRRSALLIANEPGVQMGARHYHRSNLLKVHTDDNLAYPFTKALSNRKLTQHVLETVASHPV
ncbi:hypothetical protein Tco_1068886 [Tanacetum coccineum]|uniref:Uncharacterized protein n=1 Tax=Tanacetum coccineum TaxID=301880 RepID=A0ABQ5HHZ6_9ASTR